MKRDIARELFRSYRIKTYRRTTTDQGARERLTDPGKLGEILAELIEDKDWRNGLAEGSLLTKWGDVVGSEISQNSEPITLLDGRLTIRAKSSAWATQLRLLSPELLRRIQTHPAGASTEELLIIGPSAPSWRKGVRTIRGARGPRDTYG